MLGFNGALQVGNLLKDLAWRRRYHSGVDEEISSVLGTKRDAAKLCAPDFYSG
jgi:hypothetical protein